MYALFEYSSSKSAFWGQKQCFLGKKCSITSNILHIILNKICSYAQKWHIRRKYSKYAPDEKFVAIFAFAERLPTFANLALNKLFQKFVKQRNNCCGKVLEVKSWSYNFWRKKRDGGDREGEEAGIDGRVYKWKSKELKEELTDQKNCPYLLFVNWPLHFYKLI